MSTAIRVLQYLNSTKNEGIQLGGIKEPQSPATVTAYADASYGGEKAVSQNGNLLTLIETPIIWRSRKQNTTAQSITEAEYIACSESAKDIRWIQQLLAEFQPSLMTIPAVLLTDNEAAMKLIKTQTFHDRSRHIEHKFHYIRELVDRGLIKVQGIPGKENPADILTKLIPVSTITEWKKKWMDGHG